MVVRERICFGIGFKLKLRSKLEAFGTRNAPIIDTRTSRFLREQTGNEQLCFDCAGASGSSVGPSRKTQTKKDKTLDRLAFTYVGF